MTGAEAELKVERAVSAVLARNYADRTNEVYALRADVERLDAELKKERDEHGMTWECIRMAQERLAALIYLSKWGKGEAAMFLPEAINNACLLTRDEALAYAEDEHRQCTAAHARTA